MLSVRILLVVSLAFALSACARQPGTPDAEQQANQKPLEVGVPTTEIPQNASDTRPTSIPVSELPAVQKAEACNIDRVDQNNAPTNPTAVAASAKEFELSGWIVSNDRRSVPSIISIRLEDAGKTLVWQISSRTGEQRPDVAQSLSNPALAPSGFTARMPVKDIPPGIYHLYFIHTRDGIDFACDNGAMVTIGDRAER